MSEELSVPIPAYPPFTLRSSLIDKDPVIWVHLLEAYNQLFKYLLDNNFQYLTVKSKQQLYQFLKHYLYETFGENLKIFSLGAINPDIRNNELELKQLIFHFIKYYSILKLNLIGESIWYIIGIYVESNQTVVRGLVDGSFKSKFNDNKKSGQISSINSVHTYLQKKIMHGSFTDGDLNILSILLGQSINMSTTLNLGGGEVKKTINKKKSIEFAEKFVNQPWIEILEKLYANGKSIHHKIIKDIMIISLISLPATQIIKLLNDLNIDKPSSMITASLFCSIIISTEFNELIPIQDKIPHLLNGIKSEVLVNASDINNLTSMFPDLSEGKAKTILIENDNNVDAVINILLENPDLVNFIESSYEDVPPTKPINDAAPHIKHNIAENRFKSENLSFTKMTKAEMDVKTLKEKTMIAALRAAYDSDEDEPDDTYDDVDAGVVDDGEKHVKVKTFPDDEKYLFSLYKRDGAQPFEKLSRKKSQRATLKAQIKWSDEQIEGWFKQLLKSPKKFKMLEEDYMFGEGNPNRKKPGNNSPLSVTDKMSKSLKNKEPDTKQSQQNPTTTNKGKKVDPKKQKTPASKKANHNRKSVHAKKTRNELGGGE